MWLVWASLVAAVAATQGIRPLPSASRYLLVAMAVLYEVGLTTWAGQTIGKRALGIVVVAEGGRYPSVARSLARYLVKTLVPLGWLLPSSTAVRLGLALYLLALIASIATNDARRGWHDRIAGTTVVTATTRRPVVGCAVVAALGLVGTLATGYVIVRAARDDLDRFGEGLDAQLERLHLARATGAVDFAGHHIVANPYPEVLADGEVCAHITVQATTSSSEPVRVVRVEQFALGIGADLGRPTSEATPSESSSLTPAEAYGLESVGRICARPRTAGPLVLRWHPGGTNDPVGVWFLQNA